MKLVAKNKKAVVKLLKNCYREYIGTSHLRVMNSSYFPPKPLIAKGLPSNVIQLVTSPLTVFQCYMRNN